MNESSEAERLPAGAPEVWPFWKRVSFRFATAFFAISTLYLALGYLPFADVVARPLIRRAFQIYTAARTMLFPPAPYGSIAGFTFYFVTALFGSGVVTNYDGFNRDEVIRRSVAANLPPPPEIIGGPTTPEDIAAAAARRLRGARRAFVPQFLALFAASPEIYPLTFSSPGRLDLPDGPVDLIEALDPTDGAWQSPLQRAWGPMMTGPPLMTLADSPPSISSPSWATTISAFTRPFLWTLMCPQVCTAFTGMMALTSMSATMTRWLHPGHWVDSADRPTSNRCRQW